MMRLVICCLLSIIGLGFASGSWRPPAVYAAENEAPIKNLESQEEFQSAPVVLDGVDLFRVRGVSAYPAKMRARIIASRIEALAANRKISPDSIVLHEQEDITTIESGNRLILGIVDADAALVGLKRQVLAKAMKLRIIQAVQDWRQDRTPRVLERNAIIALLATLALILIIAASFWLYRRLRNWLQERLPTRIPDVKIQKFKLITRDQSIRLLTMLSRLLWFIFLLVISYVYLQKVLSLFPWTRGLAEQLFPHLIAPLHSFGKDLFQAIPNVIFLLVLYFLVRYVLSLVRAFFSSIAEEKVVFSGFESEWAWPTYRLVRLLLVAFALVVAYPYIPGSDSAAFKGMSIFFGVLVSLGSTSLIGNVIAGYTMTYRRAFRVGDRIKVGDHLGDVVQTRLLVTYLRTPKNEQVVIPNSVILTAEVINYSSLAQEKGLILHTTVGIGYEIPWRQVEAMLMEAARKTPGLLAEPPPFVLQTSLGDFSVNYQINVYCDNPQEMIPLYAELHRNIQDIFNEYEVQIMTPAYMSDPKVVPKENWFASPAGPPEKGTKPNPGK
jgi:small-conductance mechanosensitive channel